MVYRNQRCSSSSHSKSGNSVTHTKANSVRVEQVLLLREHQPQLTEQLRVLSAGPPP